MFDKIKELVKDDLLTNKIIDALSFHGNLSVIFLMHKFKFNSLMAKKIMNVVGSFEKEMP